MLLLLHNSVYSCILLCHSLDHTFLVLYKELQFRQIYAKHKVLECDVVGRVEGEQGGGRWRERGREKERGMRGRGEQRGVRGRLRGGRGRGEGGQGTCRGDGSTLGLGTV